MQLQEASKLHSILHKIARYVGMRATLGQIAVLSGKREVKRSTRASDSLVSDEPRRERNRKASD